MEKLTLTIDSVEELCANANSDGYEFEFLQLEAGPLSTSYTGVRVPEDDHLEPLLRRFDPSHQRTGRRLHLRGVTPASSVGLVAAWSPEPFRWNGHKVACGDLVAVAPGQEMEAATPSGMEFIDVRFDLSTARSIWASAGASFDVTGVLRPPPAVWRSFIDSVLTWLGAPDPHGFAGDAKWSSTSAAVIEATIQVVAQGEPRAAGASASAVQRARIARTARDLMAEALDRTLTTADLCEATQTQARWLEVSFKERHGLAPIAYHRLLRMQKANEDLRRMGPDETSVTAVALARGFVHLGRFAVNYRTLFGESPSTTLMSTTSASEASIRLAAGA